MIVISIRFQSKLCEKSVVSVVRENPHLTDCKIGVMRNCWITSKIASVISEFYLINLKAFQIKTPGGDFGIHQWGHLWDAHL